MRLLAKVSALDGLSGSLRTLALAQLSAESGVWAFLSPKGMDKSAQGCAERTTLGRGPVPLASISEGDEYAEAFVIYPLQGMGRWLSGCPRVAAGPQPSGLYY